MALTKRQKYIALGLTLVVGTAAFIVIKKRSNAKKIKAINDILDGNKAEAGQNVITKEALAKLPIGLYPISYGAKNQKVAEIQRLLNKKFQSGIDVDGSYGQTTFDSLCKNVWNTGWTTSRYTTCYDTHITSLPTRRQITQADYEKLKQ